MAIIKCKMCGGDMVLSPDQRCGTCEYCGSTMTLPKVDDEQRASAFNRGNHFRRIGEFDKALMVYERILQEDDTDAEAHWCCALCRFGIEYVKDPASGAYVPTCHRASFDSFLEDVDYLAALQYADPVARRQYEQDGTQIAEVQRGVLKISQQEEPFDVFLCYKESDDRGQRTVDSTLAQEIYYELTEQGYRVFFARITLEDKAGQEYEPYIFAALHSARVMVVVGTKPEYLNAVWVKNEWSRYLALMKDDRKRLLIPCYRDMDPYDLPEQLSVLQSYDMSRIGFLQDLIRGIDKVLDGDKKPEDKETVILQGEGGASLTALIKRGYMSLEDQAWDKANAFFEQALNMDAECAEAFLGQLLVQFQCGSLENLVEKIRQDADLIQPETLMACPEDRERIDAIVARCQIPWFLPKEQMEEMLGKFDRSYRTELSSCQQNLGRQQAMFAENKLFVRAVRYADDTLADQLVSAKERILVVFQARVEQARKQDETKIQQIISDYGAFLDRTEQEIDRLRQEALQKRDQTYRDAVTRMEQISEQCSTVKDCEAAEASYQQLADIFSQLGDYQDSQQRQLTCRTSVGRMRQAARAIERQIKENEEKKRRIKQRNRMIGLASAAAAVLALVIVITCVVIPGKGYREAEEMLAAGNAGAAAIRFHELGGFRDAAKRSEELWAQVSSRSSIAVGANHALAVREDGTVVATGRDLENQCSGTTDWTNIISVAAGQEISLGLKADGTVVAAGDNRFNQLDFYWNDVVDIAAGDYHTVGLKADGTVTATGGFGYYHSSTAVWDWTDVVAIAAGEDTTMGLKSDGTVLFTTDGINGYYEDCLSDWTDIVAIATEGEWMLGLKSDGTVKVEGNYFDDDNEYKIEAESWENIVAIAVGDSYIVALKADGTVVATGENDVGQCNVEQWTDIVAIAAGGEYTLGLKSDGTVVDTGNNYVGNSDAEDWTQISTAYGYQG